MKQIQIFPSLLSADFGKLSEEIASVESFADGLHFDVMDGHFVPEISMGVQIFKKIKTSLPIEVHLMVENPSKLIPDFIKAGASAISIHCEIKEDISSSLQVIRKSGLKAGLAINPETELSSISHYLDQIDYVLIMSVHPGRGGQQFIESSLDKTRALRNLHPEMIIEVDGGVNNITASKVISAGANTLVSGNYIFTSDNRKEAIQNLKI